MITRRNLAPSPLPQFFFRSSAVQHSRNHGRHASYALSWPFPAGVAPDIGCRVLTARLKPSRAPRTGTRC
jgi:hypothetical protein